MYIHWTSPLGNKFFTSIIEGGDAETHAKELLEIGGIYEGCTYVISKEIPAIPLTKEELNAPILAQLTEIDAKSIRALREGNGARIADLEQQATTLRSQLAK